VWTLFRAPVSKTFSYATAELHSSITDKGLIGTVQPTDVLLFSHSCLCLVPIDLIVAVERIMSYPANVNVLPFLSKNM